MRLSLLKTFPIVFAALFAVGCPSRQAEPPKTPTVYFPGAEVCGYPAASPAKTFTRLGGGKWASPDPKTAGVPFECVGANNKVQLFNDGALIEVDYFVTGVEEGASMLTLNYSATATQPIPNESTYRNVFANLADIISKQSLRSSPDELFRKRISNLNSYSKPGTATDENYNVGAGFIALSREASEDKLNINISIKYYPDINLKLAN